MGVFPLHDTAARGELSPRTHARASLEWYRAGFQILENWIALAHGPFRKRSGSRFDGAVRDETQVVRKIPFVAAEFAAYSLEFDNTHVRFRRPDGTLVQAGGGGDYEITHPFTDTVGDIQLIQYAQSLDVMYLACPGYQPRTLSRNADNDWSFATQEFLDGPFLEFNVDRSRSVQASATTGNITLTATGFIWPPANEIVGQVIRLDEVVLENLNTFVAGNTVAANEIFRNDGKVYRNVNAAATVHGQNAPTHEIGTLRSQRGNNTSINRYLHSQFGVAQVTARTSDTVLQATVVSSRPNEDAPDPYMPDSIVGQPTYRFAYSAFSEANGWPNAVAFVQERLAYGNNTAVALSRNNNFLSFRGGANATDSIYAQIAGSQQNRVLWLAELGEALIVGTEGGIRFIAGRDGVMKPNDIKQDLVRKVSLAANQPVVADDSLFCIGWPGDKVYEVSASQSAGGLIASEATVLSEHIPKQHGGIAQMALQTRPDTILWCTMGDGQMGALTFDKDQGQAAWSRTTVGGTDGANAWGDVETLSVIPDTDQDAVQIVVRRQINAAERRYAETFQPQFEYMPISGSFHLDSAVRYSGAATTTITGLGHLEGETIQARHDNRFTEAAVAGGQITISAASSDVVAGLKYSAKARTLRPHVGSRGGSSYGRPAYISSLVLDLLETIGLKVVNVLTNQIDRVKHNNINDLQDGNASLYTGATDAFAVASSSDEEGVLEYVSDVPFPATIRAHIPNVEQS